MYDELVTFGTELITECGKLLLEKQQNEKFFIKEKNGCNDVVTEHDMWVQKYLITHIKSRYPNHAFIGEETIEEFSKEDVNFQSDWCWIIDPIDGTSNYASIGELYTISVALVHDDTLFYGWVYDVKADRLYQGMADYSITARGKEKIQECLLYMGHKTEWDLVRYGVCIEKLENSFRGVRYQGCASLEICQVAEGNRIYFNTHLSLWDFAAAAAIISKKGAYVRAALLDTGKYCVCAYRSEEVYQKCMEFMPMNFIRRMEPVTDKLFDWSGGIRKGRKQYA